jgi:UDP-glucose 4-epimerase
MRVVITGASGLIGTNLALRLLDEGHEVFGVDKDPNPWTDRVPVKIEDLRDTSGTSGADWGRADVVVHLAARAKVHESVEHPENALANYTITSRVLEYCRRHGTAIIFGSSRETYGEQKSFPVQEESVRIEGAVSPYAAAKLADEALIRAYSRCYGIPFNIIRFSNVYGRYDDLSRNGRFIPLLCQRIPRGEPVTIFGPSKAYDFTYIDDAIEGVYRCADRLVNDTARVSGYAINLGTGTGTSLLDAARLVGEAAGVEPRLTFAEIKVGEISKYIADITRARTLLGYDPQYPATRGIPEYYRWWAANNGAADARRAVPAGVR